MKKAIKEYTLEDERLLKDLRELAQHKGRTPLKKEVRRWRLFKQRFGSWEKAITAAGLSSANDSKQHSKRARERKEQNK